jgi:hypothetical protein
MFKRTFLSVQQPLDNLFYNTNQSRELAIAIKQLFELSMFDDSYGRDYLQVENLFV